MKLIESEQKLLRLTSTILLDFIRSHIELKDALGDMTVADIQNYCKGWIKENVTEHKDEL